MMRQGWKGFVLAGLLGALGLMVGCEDRNDRREGSVREEAREAGQVVDEAVQETRETTNQAVEGFQEGMGGSGQQDEAVIGDEPGVINDGEGPLEENERR